jgi:MIP family channel proteins
MKSIPQQAIAEFVGTLALVFVGAGAVTVLIGLGGLNGAALLGVGLAFGLVLAIMVSNLGHISGGHFNPAVTLSVWVTGKIETGRALVYVLAQLVGATAGAGLLRLALPEALWKRTFLGATTVAHQLGSGISISNGRAVLIEAILTFFLVFTVFATAVDDRGVFKSVAGLPIGLVLTFDILVGGALTGASMNPARSFGPALVAAKWTDFWVYILGPVTGGIIAGALYWLVFLRYREVSAPRTETPIGGGPEEDLMDDPGADPGDDEG